MHKEESIFSNESQNFLCKCLAQTPDEQQGVLSSFGSISPSTKVAQIYLFFPLWLALEKDIQKNIFFFIPRRLLFVLLAWLFLFWTICIGGLDCPLHTSFNNYLECNFSFSLFHEH